MLRVIEEELPAVVELRIPDESLKVIETVEYPAVVLLIDPVEEMISDDSVLKGGLSSVLLAVELEPGGLVLDAEELENVSTDEELGEE
jgi:hypothetical protein